MFFEIFKYTIFFCFVFFNQTVGFQFLSRYHDLHILIIFPGILCCVH